ACAAVVPHAPSSPSSPSRPSRPSRRTGSLSDARLLQAIILALRAPIAAEKQDGCRSMVMRIPALSCSVVRDGDGVGPRVGGRALVGAHVQRRAGGERRRSSRPYEVLAAGWI